MRRSLLTSDGSVLVEFPEGGGPLTVAAGGHDYTMRLLPGDRLGVVIGLLGGRGRLCVGGLDLRSYDVSY